jgi:hypothetical protein
MIIKQIRWLLALTLHKGLPINVVRRNDEQLETDAGKKKQKR